MKLPSLLTREIQNIKILWGVMLTLSCLIVFSLLYLPPTDPDLGWHIKTGELIVERGEIPRFDWFSHTFADFRWVDHEYLSNIFMSALNETFGKASVSIFYVGLITLTLVFLLGEAVPLKISWGHRALMAPFFALAFTHFTGARPQIVSWVFFVLIFVVLAKMKQYPKAKSYLALPLLFLLWANLHGGSVALGVVSLAMICFAEAIKVWHLSTETQNAHIQKSHALTYKAWKQFSLASAAAALATFINPYGYRIYEELYRTLTDSFSQRNINEWLQPDFHTYNGVILLLFLFFTIFCIYIEWKKRIDFANFIFFLAFLFLAMQSVRHIPLFVLAVAPFLLEATKEMYELIVLPLIKNLSIAFLLMGTISVAYVLFTNLPEKIVASQSEEGIAVLAGAPLGAVHYLDRHDLPGKMYNSYNWGGYLIEHLPSEKVFIDGRMPHWRTADKHLFREQRSLAAAEGLWERKLDEYGVGFAVMEKGEGLALAMQQSLDWERVYQDAVSVIYINKNFHDQKDNEGTDGES